MWHKLTRCRLSKEHLEMFCAEEEQKEWAVSVWNPMFTRGAPARPKDPPLAPEHMWLELSQSGVDKVATGRAY